MNSLEKDEQTAMATSARSKRVALLNLLDTLGLDYEETEHDAVYTMAESAALNEKLDGCRCKNLLVQTKKGTDYFLVVTAPEAKVDLGELGRRLGVGRLSFCPPQTMQELLDVTPGAASPFALAADLDGNVQLIFDTSIAKSGRFLFHPMENTATISIANQDMMRFLESIAHCPKIVDIPLRIT